ncbi:hypothetical protein BAU16_03725 [Enterococcus sp. JM9B]|nr:hypothetical protein BAU16_03725 [Enterococcus sp. JM9B]
MNNRKRGSFVVKKNYRLIYKQRYMGKVLQDVIMKYDKTVAEMEQAVNDLYSDPCVFEVWYEEVAE